MRVGGGPRNKLCLCPPVLGACSASGLHLQLQPHGLSLVPSGERTDRHKCVKKVQVSRL